MSIDELVVGIDILLGVEEAGACRSLTADSATPADVASVVSAVSNALRGCP